MSSATVNTNIYQYIDNFFQLKNILSIVGIIITISIFLTLITPRKKSFSEDYTENRTNVAGWVLSTIIFLIIFLFIMGGILQFFFGINVLLSFTNFYKKEIDLTATEPGKTGHHVKSSESTTSQVFNIPGNNYSYDDAIELCKAYGAEIANYSQLENAYNEGANWCNYGWIDKSEAYYPLQADIDDKTCLGKKGLNGGLMEEDLNICL